VAALLCASGFAQGANSAAVAPPVKIGIINIQAAIVNTNQGKQEIEALNKRFAPKQAELKTQSDEVENLKKQLNAQSDKLNDDARGSLVKNIEQKQKTFQRNLDDAQSEYQAAQNEMVQKLLQKLAPVIVKYASGNAFSVIIDTSNPWPQGPVVWAQPSTDITEAVVNTYNAQAGASSAAKPAGAGAAAGTPTRPATGASSATAGRPATASPATAPKTSTPPPKPR